MRRLVMGRSVVRASDVVRIDVVVRFRARLSVRASPRLRFGINIAIPLAFFLLLSLFRPTLLGGRCTLRREVGERWERVALM